MKQILVILGIIIGIGVLLVIALLVYSTLTDYRPKAIEVLKKRQGSVVNINDTLTIFDWNIGYAGLDSAMSFFYDGGEKMRTTKEQALKNIKGICKEISMFPHADFYLFQEVDFQSRRSYKIDIYKMLCDSLSGLDSDFAFNYKVQFIPSPLLNPLGKVQSGLASFSKLQPFIVYRHAFEGNFNWPKNLFLLDRCFMVQRFYTSNGKELLVINTHNSAFDDGRLRKQQMQMLSEFLISEYKKGNYIVVGGDWNQMPPNANAVQEYKEEYLTRIRIAASLMPADWHWSFDETVPSNREVNTAYIPGQTVTSTIDLFLTSPNLIPLNIKNIDLQFQYSDHEPVIFQFRFAN